MLPRDPEDAAEGRQAWVFSAVLVRGYCPPLRSLGSKRLCRRSVGVMGAGERFEGLLKEVS